MKTIKKIAFILFVVLVLAPLASANAQSSSANDDQKTKASKPSNSTNSKSNPEKSSPDQPKKDSDNNEANQNQKNEFLLISKNFKIRATNISLANKLSQKAEIELTRITNKLYKFTKPPTYTVEIFLWDTEAQYKKAAPNAPKNSQACTWKYTTKDGVAQYRIDIKMPKDASKFEAEILNRALPHEITHALINTFFDKNLSSIDSRINCPLALLEGFSVIAENISQDQKIILNGLILQKAPSDFSLAKLLGTTEYDEKKDSQIFYAQAYSFTTFLKSRLTADQFKSLLKNMKEGADFETSIKRALYITDQSNFLAQLEIAWKKYAIEQYNIAKSLQDSKDQESENKPTPNQQNKIANS